MESYRRYGPALRRKCERMLGNRQDAEDIVQTLFADLFARKRTDADFAYLFRATTNRCINMIRNRKRREHLLAQYHAPLENLPRRTLLDERIVGQQLLKELVRSLDKKSSEILVYRYLDDLTHEEIAALMRMSRRTVINRLGKINARLQELMAMQNGGVR